MRSAIGAALLLPCTFALAQQFEVAVIRPSAPSAGGTSFNVYDGGRVKIANEPVKLLIRTAFQLQNSQVAGVPAWVESDRYDIEAKTGRPEKPAPGTLGPYLQDMLAQRFHMQSHRETRELTVWAMVSGKGGTKLKPASEDERAGMNTSNGISSTKAVATATTMELLTVYIGNRLGAIVQDQTGLKGAYDFTLEWAPDQAANASAPSLITAIEEQLGLKLESRKSPVEVLVIDRIERPTEN
jgi:uncharacterized protein (TIGR03435 family)